MTPIGLGLTATRALLRDTFREAFARKVFWGLYGLSTALILFFLFLLKIDLVAGARASISILGQTTGSGLDVQLFVRRVHGGIASFLYTWGMALAVFASAGLIPTILEPGRIELLLSKPVRRFHILLGRYAGNLFVVALNIAYLVLGVWLIFGWKTRIWNTNFLYSMATAVFTFAVLLAVIVLIAVIWESPALATMVAFGLMIMSAILAQHRLMMKLLSSEWSRQVWKTLYYVVPKVYDVGRMNFELMMGRRIESWMPVWSSALFAAVVLGAGLYVFARRDF